MIQHIRTMLLYEANPAGTAGSKHRHHRVFILDAVEQLGTLFHDHDVRREVGV